MKTNPTFAFLFFVAFLYLGLPEAYSQSDKKPIASKDFNLSGTPSLKVEVHGASVSVQSAAGNKLQVRYFLKKDGKYLSQSDSEAQEFLEKIEITVSQSGNTVSILAKQKSSSGWNWKSNPSLSFEVIAPKDLNTDIRTSGGSVYLQEVRGTHEIGSSGGSISVKNSWGNLNSKSSGGSFNLMGFEGDAHVQTSGGSVKVEDLRGNLIAKSSGGGITLNDVSGSIDAHTSGGSIRANLPQVNREMNFQSSGGSIQVSVSSNARFNVELKGGGISSQLSNFQGTTAKNLVSGKVNGGGPTIQMQSSGGSIRIGNAD
ncbi:DUF4097 family beta strand repeat-containing protein [Algoriphagus mannitolivorans]|uniref:DUF4097 family beta strand repeat-containing protein n=1 Tax=Algoriphagus mannitolivorans TaxID=226504 RepID=UPI000412F212|nr:DUF4097 family beta strand repeat-containing protein [Algoriphagus mannitolivorans]